MAEQALVFAVRRRDVELVGPAAPTPRETKRLSDIDDKDVLRMDVSLAFFYSSGEDGVALGDPAGVIRRALGEALVHYYPLAGRLREVEEGRKLVVDCTGEGVLFVEAEADVRLAELHAAGQRLRPPFPCMERLLLEVEGFSGLLGTPLMLIQVTRLLCSGFVFALRHIHTMCDATSIAQFINAIAELACGFPAPTVAPTWSRELLEVPCPPTPSFPHSEFDFQQSAAAARAAPVTRTFPAPGPVDGDMVVRSFTFGPSEVAAIKKRLPSVLRNTTTTFEVLAAFLWRARTAALEFPPNEVAPLVIIANFRAAAELGLPSGYYGNAVVRSMALADAAALRRGSLVDAVALVRQAKVVVTADYVRSAVVQGARGRPSLLPANMYLVSDLRRVGFQHVDFGWGRPVFGGPCYPAFRVGIFTAFTDRNGEDMVVVPVALPRQAMERFAVEMEGLFISNL